MQDAICKFQLKGGIECSKGVSKGRAALLSQESLFLMDFDKYTYMPLAHDVKTRSLQHDFERLIYFDFKNKHLHSYDLRTRKSEQLGRYLMSGISFGIKKLNNQLFVSNFTNNLLYKIDLRMDASIKTYGNIIGPAGIQVFKGRTLIAQTVQNRLAELKDENFLFMQIDILLPYNLCSREQSLLVLSKPGRIFRLQQFGQPVSQLSYLGQKITQISCAQESIFWTTDQHIHLTPASLFLNN